MRINHTSLSLKIIAAVTLTAAIALPSFAHNLSYRDRKEAPESPAGASPRATDKKMNKMAQMMERAEKAIDNRIANLTNLSTRLQGMKKITDADKIALASVIANQITELTNLKQKIASDTDDPATLKIDVQSITKAYRIYALIMPQIAILAAADRTAVIAETMTTVANKLETRLNETTMPSDDAFDALKKTLAHMKVKIADANTQIEKVRAAISALAPDNGDQAVFKSNSVALKNAHAIIKTAMQDLRAARKDTDTIIKALRKYGTPALSPSVSVSPSPTPSAS